MTEPTPAGSRRRSTQVVELEKAGLDMVWVAEAYSFDAISQVGYLAARTERVEIGTGIVNVYSRTPALMAMTAAGLRLRQRRSLHPRPRRLAARRWSRASTACPYEKPMPRIKEYIEVCRMIWKREEQFDYHGQTVQVPLPAGRGHRARQAAEADQPPGAQRHPDLVGVAHGPQRRGHRRDRRRLAADHVHPREVPPGVGRPAQGRPGQALGRARPRSTSPPAGMVAIGEDLVGDGADHASSTSPGPSVALYVGGMGARGKNFYNDVAQRYGYEKEAVDIQDLYLDGKKDEAAAHVPGEWLELSNLVGPESYIKERVGAFKEAGVTVLAVNPVGPDAVNTDRDSCRDLWTTHDRRRQTPVGGTVAPGWEPVADAFESQLRRPAARSARRCPCTTAASRWSTWSGGCVRRGRHPALRPTTRCSWCSPRRRASRRSRSAICVQRGLLDYGGAGGRRTGPSSPPTARRTVTVAQLLVAPGRAGRRSTAPSRLDEVARLGPHGRPARRRRRRCGSRARRHGYHAVTYGWLAGELVRRVDPQRRSLGRVRGRRGGRAARRRGLHRPARGARRTGVAAGDLGAAGRPGSGHSGPRCSSSWAPTRLAGGRCSLNGGRSLRRPGLEPPERARAPRSRPPTASRHGASLARIYAACVGEVDGVRLLDPAHGAPERARPSRPTASPTACSCVPTTFGMGFMTSGPFTPMLGPGSFGHAGAGGSLAFGASRGARSASATS